MQNFPSPEAVANARLLVVGDLMVDHYLEGEVSRVSPEAPVPVVHLRQEWDALGGAANVIRNLVALGARPEVGGIIGDDETGRRLRSLLAETGVASDGLVVEPGRMTTLKSRVTARMQQMLRVDRETGEKPKENSKQALLDYCLKALERCNGLILSDYGKGTLEPDFCRALISEARKRGLPVFVDPKGKSFEKYRDASFITPNRAEAEGATVGEDVNTLEALEDQVKNWNRELDLSGMLVTLGREGMLVCSGSGENFKCRRIEAEQREVYDVTGAGDTVISVFALCHTAGLDVFESARWANLAAGVVVGKAGPATATRQEILHYAERFEPWQRKVRSLEQLTPVVEEARRRGLKVIFTNGCFDLLHAGHIQLLQAARRLGDILVVGLNSDDSVRRIKGRGRPVLPEQERLHVLASLDCVDYLVVYPQETPHDVLRALRPDVLVKGANYAPEQVMGYELVQEYGGKVERVPIRKDISVSGLVESIVQQFGRGSSEEKAE
jgi:D-beta-D-heptose 7-phosphate kinase / D-beta-D-heptose 1-phosphate adenosyltransferase